MAAATDIRTLKAPWQTRLGVSGAVVQGDAALDQFIRVVIGTQLGSVPLQNDLGVDWLGAIDLPFDDALPIIISGVAKAFRKWIEPRAKFGRVVPVRNVEQLTAQVYYYPAGSDAEKMVVVAP
jgi:phage baseplate assembly protein W